MEVGSETRRYLVLDMVAIMEGSKGYANQGNRTRPRSREQWTLGMMVTMDGGSFGELWSWAVTAGGGDQIPDTVTSTASAIYQ